jgi:hypothetical protein
LLGSSDRDRQRQHNLPVGVADCITLRFARLLLFRLRNLLCAGRVVLLFRGARFCLFLRCLLVRSLWRFVTHDPQGKFHDKRSQYGCEGIPHETVAAAVRCSLAQLHDRPEHPGDELFCSEPMHLGARFLTRSGLQNQLKDALPQFLDRRVSL